MRNHFIILIISVLPSLSALAGNQEGFVTKDIIVKGLNSQNHVAQTETLSLFSKNLSEYCKEAQLPSCVFPKLFNLYRQDIANLNTEELSGLQTMLISENPQLSNALPLQSGAWHTIPFAFADGETTVVRMILTKIGLEKAILEHKAYIESKNKKQFSVASTFYMQQMISLFYGFSKSIKILKYAQDFKCLGTKSPELQSECLSANNFINSLKKDVQDTSSDLALTKIANLDGENSIDKTLKVNLVITATKAISNISKKLSLNQIVESLNAPENFEETRNLKKIIAEMSSTPVCDSSEDFHKMLVATAILSEVQGINNLTSEIPSNFTYVTTGFKEQINLELTTMINTIDIYLTEQEEIPQ